ncbi:hypothetical protein [Falsiroseomonas tokyonensis]|uniref:Serine protease n=1 Tax=Falsiroseomonas tokyonensis TaxID=430521 RepID=A0ABV7BY50_9PROT|nr:hypothetical protein [Falsiroseomonas tokyonensis]MBU8539122.1 hypothetical protein [Falsiroseomonas tokyonensis]
MAQLRSGESARCLATGGAVHVGGGRFVTAAHVVDGSAQRLRGVCPQGAGPLVLGIAGSPAPARLLAAGQDRIDRGIGQRYLDGEDVALLRPVGAFPSLGAARLCAGLPQPGQPALLVTPQRAIRTRLLPPVADPDPRFGAYLEIPETLLPGESGGAVFESASGCLAGLVSHRDEPERAGSGPARTRLVPAPVIARFLGRVPQGVPQGVHLGVTAP